MLVGGAAKGDGIYKYARNNRNWTKYVSYPESFSSVFHTIAYNKNTKHLLISFGMHGKTYCFNLQSKEFKTIEQIVDDTVHLTASSALCINNEYHIIGGFGNKWHL